MGLGANPYRFFRCKNERERKFIENAVEWQKERKVSRKLAVIRKVAEREGQKREIVIPEDVEIPKRLLQAEE